MISLGIDIGTTSICAVLYDLTEDKIIKSLSTPNSFINTGSYLQDPDRIVYRQDREGGIPALHLEK